MSSVPETIENLEVQETLFSPSQVLENRGRVAIFIDGSNLFYAALQLGIEIDYTKLLLRLTCGSRLLRSFFYTGVDPSNEKQQGFLLWMSRNGYRVITKDLVQLPDGSKKANLDVEIAVDMLALTGAYDTAILVSGDGDLAYAVDAVSYRGIRVEVVSLRSMTSDSLINVADRYIDLEHIKDDIRKASRTSYTYRPLSENPNATKSSSRKVVNPVESSG
ncbi:LabA-like NYN domain-containing protein [Lyngbya confervoides]|uniref:NYN domain-containing protein n=1 Tax=Lyngbya confervoides BDU141951 TaxID=1574623 RepID=A0ABD4T378_9CYAN|nr:NYN domain-containing protein [Lyngbya confervoides]MCM1982692.1 NYN domain-containing protein [Lyngbya confervoides BDU141951]